MGGASFIWVNEIAQAATAGRAPTVRTSAAHWRVTAADQRCRQGAKMHVDEAAQAICDPGAISVCTGWANGGRRCLANCSGTNYWADTGAAYWFSVPACYPIDYGQCGSTAQSYCNGLGRSYQGACWGHR